MSYPKLYFKTIEDFSLFCIKNNINPIINLIPKKHSNMRGECFHILSGQLIVDNNNNNNNNNNTYNYKIKEIFTSKIKYYKREEGYLLAELL